MLGGLSTGCRIPVGPNISATIKWNVGAKKSGERLSRDDFFSGVSASTQQARDHFAKLARTWIRLAEGFGKKSGLPR
jgi:hypothetical protein